MSGFGSSITESVSVLFSVLLVSVVLVASLSFLCKILRTTDDSAIMISTIIIVVIKCWIVISIVLICLVMLELESFFMLMFVFGFMLCTLMFWPSLNSFWFWKSVLMAGRYMFSSMKAWQLKGSVMVP